MPRQFGPLSDGDARRVKNWLRQSVPLEDRMTTGLLAIQHAGNDQKVRLSYNVAADMTMWMSGKRFMMGQREKTCVIVAEYSFDVVKLEGTHPEEEVVINGQPLGWELNTFGINGALELEFTFPSVLSAVTYADLTRTK